MVRKSLEETWQYFESEGEVAPRRPDGSPLVPIAMPNHDDAKDEMGISYFKYRLQNADHSNLTLPRTFFGRSHFIKVQFTNTDLTESRMCWNDFEECDFSRADLSSCDMRSSIFKNCRFVHAVLRLADLRRSSFEGCDFTGADLNGAIGEDSGPMGYVGDFLTDAQVETMTWQEDEGPEPPGG